MLKQNGLNRNVISAGTFNTPPEDDGRPITIGRSHVAMWIRVVSSWVCLIIYAWSLLAPVVLPDRFE